MNTLCRHLVVCLLTGLVAILLVGGTVILVVLAEKSPRPLVPANLYFPGVGLICILVLLCWLGLRKNFGSGFIV